MKTVDTEATEVNETGHAHSVEDAVKWVEAQASKGDMGESGARLRVTSVQALAEQVAADEPKTVGWILSNIDRLRERWARRHMEAKSDTANTYASRAKTTLLAYVEWVAAPDKYNPRKVLLKKGDPTSAKSAKKAARAKPAAAAPAQAQLPIIATVTQPSPRPSRNERNFPLGGDRAVYFTLPEDGLVFAEVKKLAVHLFTLATDFDISDPVQAQVFSMVVRGIRE